MIKVLGYVQMVDVKVLDIGAHLYEVVVVICAVIARMLLFTVTRVPALGLQHCICHLFIQ